MRQVNNRCVVRLFSQRVTQLVRVLSCGLLCLMLSAGTVAAQSNQPQEVLKRLTDFTESLKSFSANFVQTVYDANDTQIQESSGNVLLKRPGRFVWNYIQPAQQIVADGQSIWLYDIELEQVTVSPLTEQGAGTPLALLMGDKPLEQEFELRPLGQSDGIEWGQATQIRFSAFKPDVSIDDEKFRFIPPAGVDVIGNG